MAKNINEEHDLGANLLYFIKLFSCAVLFFSSDISSRDLLFIHFSEREILRLPVHIIREA